jgi:hypothetical protein
MESVGIRTAAPSTGLVEGVVASLRVWRRRDALDTAIARGDRLKGELAVRARQLTRRHATAALAGELDSALAWALEAEGPSHPGAIDISRDAIAGVAPELRQLIEGLRSNEPPEPGGVALAKRLVRDIDSPLYEPARPDELRAAIAAAITGLGPVAPQRPASLISGPHTDLVMTAEYSTPSRWPQVQHG